jgi:hypothetical protein
LVANDTNQCAGTVSSGDCKDIYHGRGTLTTTARRHRRVPRGEMRLRLGIS